MMLLFLYLSLCFLTLVSPAAISLRMQYGHVSLNCSFFPIAIQIAIKHGNWCNMAREENHPDRILPAQVPVPQSGGQRGETLNSQGRPR